MTKAKSLGEAQLRLRIRVRRGEEIALGPGKAELLALVGETGSIRQAAKRMSMSYMRAWSLVRTMNGCFVQPLVEAGRGGAKGGGARLTSVGAQVLSLYHEMEEVALKASRKPWEQIARLMLKEEDSEFNPSR